MSIQIDFPEDVEQSLRREFGESLERRAKEDLAAKWFTEGRLTSGQAADMLGISWVEAQALLKERGGVLPMTIEDVEADLASLRGPSER